MSEGGQLEENQAASPEHTAALPRNLAVRCDSSFVEVSPPYLPKGWIGFHASGPSERRLETLDHVDRLPRAFDLRRVNLAGCPFRFREPVTDHSLEDGVRFAD